MSKYGFFCTLSVNFVQSKIFWHFLGEIERYVESLVILINKKVLNILNITFYFHGGYNIIVSVPIVKINVLKTVVFDYLMHKAITLICILVILI